MSAEFILVAGPMVRAASWEPTADDLRQAGWPVQVPDILAHCAEPPAWHTWSRHLLDHVAPAAGPILVGHSSASVLVADLATKLSTRGVIIVDGDIPPTQGRAAPVRPALHDFIRSLAAEDGTLPVWSRWFSHVPERAALVGLDRLAHDPPALAQFEAGLPTMPISWFDDAIDLAPWDHVPAGFVQTSAIYDHAAAEALRRGWPVERLSGSHLHPTLCPAETASAILSIARQLDARVGSIPLTAASRRTGPDRDRH
ncbi:conserved hypothetical protein [Bradyrhizobium oligotrophicum S58]|uniref:Uncharacterized protein n=1 Tax=Bradyrhizobium oligotrophicum S58 TaxID=1245469 RepID=M4ZBR1_9BRAD|nr:alpha/beta fold hydrolase [Bradyrhizobium oligotrophicum]BAM91214.1 conserved hypothetical protein [Bradyrhizobium oligotrophicum S58]